MYDYIYNWSAIAPSPPPSFLHAAHPPTPAEVKHSVEQIKPLGLGFLKRN